MTQTAEALPQLPAGAEEKLRALLGDDRLVVDRPTVDEYKDPYWIPGDETYAASAVVLPSSTEEVQEIIRIAGEFDLPVWPHSQGRNFGYGGASPVKRGSLQISFHRMNRVLEIDEELGFAVVEPGVRWFDLYDALEAAGSNWAVSVPDLGWGSIIGNSMDSGITYMPTGAEYQAICGLEVVLADGSLLRTNQGAHPKSNVGHVYRRSLGPSLDWLFVQSNFGIVVRAGVWLNRKQEAYAPVVLTIMEDEDLEQAVDTLRELRQRNLLDGAQSFYPTLRAAVMIEDAEVVSPKRQLTGAEVREIGVKHNVGAWSMRAAVWGDRDEVELSLKKIEQAWSKIPSGRFRQRGLFSPDEYGEIEYAADRIQAGIPNLTAIENTPDHVAHIGFSPVVALTGSEVRKLVDEMRSRILAQGINFSGGLLVTGDRSAVMVAGMQYDVTNTEQVRATFDFARRFVVELGELGYGEYRAHMYFMDLAQAQYSFGDHAYRRFVEKIKDAVDPEGILSPGRHGIWPSKYADERKV
ncbi:MAG: FAD-binding oxidoreductase [Leucobacter sp.]